MTIANSPRRGASNAVAVLALIIALAALFFALCTDPIKPGFAFKVPFSSALSAYDFESASGAYKSQMQAQMNMDIRAMIELERKVRDKETKEKLDTLKIDSEHDFKSAKNKDEEEIEYKVLLISYKLKGKDKKEYVAMKKDKESGIWTRGFVSAGEVDATNKDLAKKMREYSGEPDLPRFN